MILTGPTFSAAQLAWAIPRALSADQELDAYNMAADLYMIADDPRYVIASIVDWALGAATLLGDGEPLTIDRIFTPDGTEIDIDDAAPEIAQTSRIIVMASRNMMEEAAECLMVTELPLLHLIFMEMAMAYADLLRTHFLNPN